MAKLTPPLGIKGRFSLRNPWVTYPDKIFKVIAIRSFADIYKLGKDVFTVYYEPYGLSAVEFQNDVTEGANLITLQLQNAVAGSSIPEYIYVPDTYIESYPNMGDVAYSHVVLSLSLGALPDTLNLDFLKAQVASVVSDVVGITPTVNLHVAGTVGAMSPADHEVAEAARYGAVVLRETERAKRLKLQAQVNALLSQVAILEQIIVDKGLLD